MKITKLTATMRNSFWFLAFSLIATTIFAANPWVQTYTPVRQLYVSPTGTGSGTQASPMSLANAIANAKAGDLYWMMQGTYSGKYYFTKKGTASQPIVFRAIAGQNVKIVGSMQIVGEYTWIWGLQISDPNNSTSGIDGCISVVTKGVHLINNSVYSPGTNKNTLTAWNQGPGVVIYGNIIYNGRHNLYTQNDYTKYGYKYIIGNMIMDSYKAINNNAQNVQIYAEGGTISGFHLEGNVFVNGRVLLGGLNKPADNEVFLKNYIYKCKTQFGYNAPSQVKFQNNYMGRSDLWAEWFWGVGEKVYTQTAPNIFSGNEIYYPPAEHIEFSTAAYLPGLCKGCPKIKSSDTFDNNKYSSPFSAEFDANNRDLETIDWNKWRTETANAGKAFDTNSTVVTSIPDKVVVIPNEYEAGRGHLVIFNWSRKTSRPVDLSSVVGNGKAYKILDPKNIFGTPIASGTYSGAVNVNNGGAEFSVYLITSSGGSTQSTIFSSDWMTSPH